MQWSGEHVENPCEYVFGIVLDLVLKGQCGKVCFLVDFGCYFSIHEVPVELCEAGSPSKPILEETKAWETVIATTMVEPCSLVEMIGIPTM